jgi:hypothetical protein
MFQSVGQGFHIGRHLVGKRFTQVKIALSKHFFLCHPSEVGRSHLLPHLLCSDRAVGDQQDMAKDPSTEPDLVVMALRPCVRSGRPGYFEIAASD